MITKDARSFSYPVTVLIMLLACVLLLIAIKTPFVVYDEGFAVFNATRIINGDIPYKDFWSIYPPGQFYTLAILFKSFGTTLFVSRIYDTVVRLLIVFSVWLIAEKITSHPQKYFAVITTALLLGSAGFYSYAVFPALALGLLGISTLLRYLDTGQRYFLFLSGFFLGLTFFFRLDFGLYFGLSVFATIILNYLLNIRQENASSIRMLFTLSEISIMTGIISIVVVTIYGYLGILSGFTNLLEHVVIFPATMFRSMRWLPYPTLLPTLSNFLEWIRFYFPMLVYGVGFFSYVNDLRKKRIILNTQYFGKISVFILGVFLFAQALSRYDYIHIIPTSLMATLVVYSTTSSILLKSPILIIRLMRVLVFSGFISLYIVLPTIILAYYIRDFSPLGCYSQIEKASCVYIDKNQEDAIDYIKAHTNENESIFVGNQRHDTILINDIGFYFLSARQSSTKYSELHPGVATTLPVQKSIVQSIELRSVKWIVLVQVPESTEPNASAISSHVTYLDEFILSNYSLVKEFGNYQIWQLTAK